MRSRSRSQSRSPSVPSPLVPFLPSPYFREPT
jgi:hypothetical protein